MKIPPPINVNTYYLLYIRNKERERDFVHIKMNNSHAIHVEGKVVDHYCLDRVLVY